MNGAEWALQAVLKSLNMDPETVKNQIAGMAQITSNAQAQLNRIEAGQNFIIAYLRTQPDFEKFLAGLQAAAIANGSADNDGPSGPTSGGLEGGQDGDGRPAPGH